MSTQEAYPIGTPGVPWGTGEKETWLARQSVQRSYAGQVEARIKALGSDFKLEQYGMLAGGSNRYALHALSSRDWSDALPSVLITGGVHGYETSGVMGALSFLELAALPYVDRFNFVVLPCISPWAFETINRWNPDALDPNRSFVDDSPCVEAAAVVSFLQHRERSFLAHFDLHETTDTDNTEFRPALAARDAKPQDRWDIPDGFYSVADASRRAPEFQAAVIRSVAQVTHIAPAIDGRIIGEELQPPGVICYDGKGLGLCMGVTDAPYVVTTEMYPDSPRVTAQECVDAQLAAVRGGLDYLLKL